MDSPLEPARCQALHHPPQKPPFPLCPTGLPGQGAHILSYTFRQRVREVALSISPFLLGVCLVPFHILGINCSCHLRYKEKSPGGWLPFWALLAGSKGWVWARTRKICSGPLPGPWWDLASQTQAAPGQPQGSWPCCITAPEPLSREPLQVLALNTVVHPTHTWSSWRKTEQEWGSKTAYPLAGWAWPWQDCHFCHCWSHSIQVMCWPLTSQTTSTTSTFFLLCKLYEFQVYNMPF